MNMTSSFRCRFDRATGRTPHLSTVFSSWSPSFAHGNSRVLLCQKPATPLESSHCSMDPTGYLLYQSHYRQRFGAARGLYLRRLPYELDGKGREAAICFDLRYVGAVDANGSPVRRFVETKGRDGQLSPAGVLRSATGSSPIASATTRPAAPPASSSASPGLWETTPRRRPSPRAPRAHRPPTPSTKPSAPSTPAMPPASPTTRSATGCGPGRPAGPERPKPTRRSPGR